ncbi:MAG: 4Fe-4S dicluster domain-containing protein [Candidatus Bathyarchaeota archaeon]|nr:4Fe-4S dicluster domain-containing protein [Candidatus Bathyarchaeota archaeon]
MKAYILPEKCIKCRVCRAARACPLNIIFKIDSDEPSIVDSGQCHGCGDCTEACPVHAVVLREG